MENPLASDIEPENPIMLETQQQALKESLMTNTPGTL